MTILEEVVQHELCCCCGLCAAVCPQKCLTIRETKFGEFFPSGECAEPCGLCADVCPVTTTTLMSSCTGERNAMTVGYVGAVSQETERLKAPSGGFATAMLCRLRTENKIDAAVVASPISERPWFERRIATTAEEILHSRGSVYHVLKNDDVLREIINGPERRYAIVALPCMTKAIRLAQKRIPELERRIRYVFSLTCGGCNTLHIPDLLTVMLGNHHAEIRYHSKRNSKNARDYAVDLPNNPKSRSVKMLGLFGFLWINHVGRLTSCLYCNDVFGEYADVTFMDAWLPEYIPDARGTSLAIFRNTELTKLFDDMFADGTLQGSTIPLERVYESQASLVEERRKVPTSNFLAFYRDIRKLLQYYSHHLARKPNWYSRFYVIRFFWLTFLSLTRHLLLKKTFQSLHFLKKEKD